MTRTSSDNLEKHSLLLMTAQQIGNASTMGFQIVMGWTLSPSEYAVLASLLGLTLIVATPTEAIRTAIAHFSARLVQEGRPADIRTLLRRWCGYLAWVAIPVLLAGVLFGKQLGGFFHLDAGLPILVTGIGLALCLFLPLFLGALQGLQSFVFLTLAGQSWGIARLVLGALLVWGVSATALSGLIAQTAAFLIALVISGWALRAVIGLPPAEPLPVMGTRSYVVRSLFILAGYAVLMSADIVLVRHFLPEQSGNYARASMIARSVVFFSQPIVGAMFPKVASSGTISRQNWRTLFKAVLYSLLCVSALAGVVLLMPQFPLLVIFKDAHPTAELIRLIRWAVIAMSPLGLVYLLMNFELAQHRFGAAFPLIFCALAFVGAASLYHESLGQILAALGVANLLCLILLVAGLPWKKFRSAAAA